MAVNRPNGQWATCRETDIQGAGITDNHTALAGPALIEHKLNWFGTTRARAGLATGSVLSYVTGGVAYGGIETGVSTPAASLTNSTTKTGWTWGTGVEAALGGNWTAKAEYLYINFGSTGVASAATGAAPSAKATGAAVRSEIQVGRFIASSACESNGYLPRCSHACAVQSVTIAPQHTRNPGRD